MGTGVVVRRLEEIPAAGFSLMAIGSGAVPARLRPTAPIAPDAVLAGDPGRALLLAQELLEHPKMSNHARGLWGYSGQTPAGRPLTIQATGIGGPSAALVLVDLAELGVRRVVRVGSCRASAGGARPGRLLIVERAIAEGGSATSFGVAVGDSVEPDRALAESLGEALGGDAETAVVASFDSQLPAGAPLPAPAVAADMQTVATLARARSLGIVAAAVLIVEEAEGSAPISDEDREEAAKRGGAAAAAVLSP